MGKRRNQVVAVPSTRQLSTAGPRASCPETTAPGASSKPPPPAETPVDDYDDDGGEEDQIVVVAAVTGASALQPDVSTTSTTASHAGPTLDCLDAAPAAVEASTADDEEGDEDDPLGSSGSSSDIEAFRRRQRAAEASLSSGELDALVQQELLKDRLAAANAANAEQLAALSAHFVKQLNDAEEDANNAMKVLDAARKAELVALQARRVCELKSAALLGAVERRNATHLLAFRYFSRWQAVVATRLIARERSRKPKALPQRPQNATEATSAATEKSDGGIICHLWRSLKAAAIDVTCAFLNAGVVRPARRPLRRGVSVDDETARAEVRFIAAVQRRSTTHRSFVR